MNDLPLIATFVEKIKENKPIQLFGIVLQEAHDSKIWPIGKQDAPPPSFTVEERIQNAKLLEEKFPMIEWIVDVPNRDWFHVGSSFNNIFRAWPHHFFIFHGRQLIYRSKHHIDSVGETWITFHDVISFLDSYS